MSDTGTEQKNTNRIDTNSWVDRYGDTLFRYAFYRVSDRTIVEDLVQETFMAALNSAGSFASRSSQKTWLLGILKHKILDHYRHKLNTLNSRRGVKVHPTQLYMAGLDPALFAIVWALLPRLPVGSIFLAFLVWHGFTRILVEQIRFDIIHHEGRNWTT